MSKSAETCEFSVMRRPPRLLIDLEVDGMRKSTAVMLLLLSKVCTWCTFLLAVRPVVFGSNFELDRYLT